MAWLESALERLWMSFICQDQQDMAYIGEEQMHCVQH